MVEALTDLPPNVLMEILVRLPLKTLFVSRCVCKNFLGLTSLNPHFIGLDAANATQILMLQFGEDFKPSDLLRFIDPELDIAPEFVKKFILKPLFHIPQIRKRNVIYYRGAVTDEENLCVLVNSCNGLLYLVRRHALDERSLVCNPVTNEYVVIPGVDTRFETMSMWLGFSPGCNKYKVLRIVSLINGDPANVGAQVLVVGSNSWRDIGHTFLGREHSWDSCSTFLNGVMYWLDNSWKDIVSFDFEREMFGDIALPSELGEEQVRNKHFMSIGVLKGCLCLSYNVHNDHHVDIWVMTKHGNQGSWRKEFIVDTARPTGRPPFGQFKPLQVLRNGQILMLWIGNDLVCYDPRNKSLRFVGFHWLNVNHRMAAFTPSFVPLKDALKVDNVRKHYKRPSGKEDYP
ncbi:hypothetical protein CDL12_04423 [Handroanthus impetiginosus]|uniref:F-box domain-containing protein n=1 Tax=Handroanthus impetiginosus TaxID=429701 RepID=A0A2G9HZC8_9LAMI|nr:hypothetical protein CDL12_04423 [Handroanthus impetiginosus]